MVPKGGLFRQSAGEIAKGGEKSSCIFYLYLFLANASFSFLVKMYPPMKFEAIEQKTDDDTKL